MEQSASLLDQGPPSAAQAVACANIALVKYWGKRSRTHNLPAQGSLSITLQALQTKTTLSFVPGERDRLVVDGEERSQSALEKARLVLDAVRDRASLQAGAQIDSQNNFPYGSGLASSASGLAALAGAAAAAAGLSPSLEELSRLARLGSGSACRSLHGGFVEWLPGQRSDGEDSYAIPLYPADYWDLRVLVLLVDAPPKKIPSTQGMLRTAETSPYHRSWLQGVQDDLEEARQALGKRDLERLGTVAEASCLKMHADALAAAPGLLYWRGPTIEIIHTVRQLRQQQGLPLYFTIDAGPHVKILTLPETVESLLPLLGAIPGVSQIIESAIGGPIQINPPLAQKEGAVPESGKPQ